jgi:hypothetical protein
MSGHQCHKQQSSSINATLSRIHARAATMTHSIHARDNQTCLGGWPQAVVVAGPVMWLTGSHAAEPHSTRWSSHTMYQWQKLHLHPVALLPGHLILTPGAGCTPNALLLTAPAGATVCMRQAGPCIHMATQTHTPSPPSPMARRSLGDAGLGCNDTLLHPRCCRCCPLQNLGQCCSQPMLYQPQASLPLIIMAPLLLHSGGDTHHCSIPQHMCVAGAAGNHCCHSTSCCPAGPFPFLCSCS